MKINATHLECVKNYLEEDRSIKPANAMNKLKKDTGLEINYKTFYSAFAKLKKETYNVDNASSSKIRSKNWEYGLKLSDTHIECLKNYLRENMSIGNTEATNRLYQETGLKVSVFTTRRALLKLEQEINQENLDLESSDSAPKADTKPWIYGLKLKPLHIEYLKKYLSENSSIGYTEATDRLLKDTGLNVSVQTIRNNLQKLKNEINQDSIGLKLPNSTAKVRCRTGNYGFKLKDLHTKLLKKYLNENSYISDIEARDRLYDETGLKVSTITVRKVLKEFFEQDIIDSSTNNYSIRKNTWGYGYKLKDSHIESLKNYLNENSSITLTEAKNRLYKESGLQVSTSTISKVFFEFRIQVSLDQDSISSPASNSKNKSKAQKLKDSHLELLKNYINENYYIGAIEAKDRLFEETGLKVSVRTIYSALNILKNRTISEKKLTHSYSLDSKTKNFRSKYGIKLKEVHVECLKKYLNDDMSIGITAALNKLYDETGLKLSDSPIKKALKSLRKEIEQEHNNSLSSTS